MHCGKFCSIDEFDCCTVIKRELLFLFLFALILFSPLSPSLSVGEFLTGQIPMAPIFSVLTQLYLDEFKMGQSVCKCGRGKISQSKNTPVYQLWDYFTGLGSRELPCMVLYLLCLSASCISPTLPRLLMVPT